MASPGQKSVSLGQGGLVALGLRLRVCGGGHCVFMWVAVMYAHAGVQEGNRWSLFYLYM